ncbi:hypothetical protein JXA48_03310 [Candidatus Woesearchaeota archaeon]|nr:hypothetical protein [Candidatus Woesearchaeota archaeon]
MNIIKKSLAGLAFLVSTAMPMKAQMQTDSTLTDSSKQKDVSFFADISARNGYYFSIGPLAGNRETSKFVTQADFGAAVGNFTLSTWTDYAPLRGQVDEIDVSATYDLFSKDFKIGKQPFNLSATAGIMAFMYPVNSQAGGATDWLPNVNLNLSTPLFGEKSTSLNLFYMHDVVKDPVQNGGALMVTLDQEVGKFGPVSLSTNAYGAYGTDLYEFNGFLLSRIGAKASMDIGKNSSISADYSYQFTGPNQSETSIPQESIFGITFSTNFK